MNCLSRIMLQQKILPKHCNELQNELIKLFHSSGMPLHFNKTGNKEFTNYQRISLIILLRRSKKSLRDFVVELRESRWTSWLDLRRIPGKSTLHDWIKMFKMKTIRQLFKLLKPKKSTLTAIDGTGFDSWQRSRHYEKRVNEIGDLPHMPYAKADLFIDVKTRKVLDFNLNFTRMHDVKVAEKIFKRFNLKNKIILADKGYDSEPLHELVRNKRGILYAPVRKTDKRSFKRKRPKGFYRRKCVELPEYYHQRSIIEAINFSIKKKQITSLMSKKKYMQMREFAWQMITYNLRINLKIKCASMETEQNYFFVLVKIYFFPDSPFHSIAL